MGQETISVPVSTENKCNYDFNCGEDQNNEAVSVENKDLLVFYRYLLRLTTKRDNVGHLGVSLLYFKAVLCHFTSHQQHRKTHVAAHCFSKHKMTNSHLEEPSGSSSGLASKRVTSTIRPLTGTMINNLTNSETKQKLLVVCV